MTIGERRFRVVFQKAVITKDDFGEPDKSWNDICTSWALVQPMKGAERFSAGQAQADVDHRIVVRNRSELKSLGPADRVLWNGHVYDIRSVIFRDHRQSELEILAREHF